MMEWIKWLLFKPKSEKWYWECLDCTQHGEGDEKQVRHDSTKHCLTFAHAIRGGHV